MVAVSREAKTVDFIIFIIIIIIIIINKIWEINSVRLAQQGADNNTQSTKQ